MMNQKFHLNHGANIRNGEATNIKIIKPVWPKNILLTQGGGQWWQKRKA